MDKQQLVKLLQTAKPGWHVIGEGHDADDVLALWAEHVHYRDRRNFDLLVWRDGTAISIVPRGLAVRYRTQVRNLVVPCALAAVAVLGTVAWWASL